MSYELNDETKSFVAKIIYNIPATEYSSDFSSYLDAIQNMYFGDIRMHNPLCLHLMYFWLHMNKNITVMDMEILANGAKDKNDL